MALLKSIASASGFCLAARRKAIAIDLCEGLVAVRVQAHQTQDGASMADLLLQVLCGGGQLFHQRCVLLGDLLRLLTASLIRATPAAAPRRSRSTR